MPHKTDDVRIKEIKELAPPSHVVREFPIDEKVSDLVYDTRAKIHRIVHGMDDRLVVIIGPCSIHDPAGPTDTYLLRHRYKIRLHAFFCACSGPHACGCLCVTHA